jgi:hypothetical protein
VLVNILRTWYCVAGFSRKAFDRFETTAITFELKPDQEFEILGELVGVICSRVES